MSLFKEHGVLVSLAVFIALPFFARSTLLPIGGQSQIYYYLAQVALAVGFLVIAYKSAFNIHWASVALVLFTLPSALAITSEEYLAVRWIGWLLMLGCLGPLFCGKMAAVLHESMWKIVTWGTASISITSFVLFAGGFSLGGRGSFSGIMIHSMILAPITSLAAIHLYQAFLEKPRVLHGVLLIAIMTVMIAAGSRSAALGFGFAAVWLTIGRRGSDKFGLLFVAIAVILILAFYNKISQQDEDLRGFATDILHKGALNTRESLWEARIIEFKSAPLWGIGFGVQQEGVMNLDDKRKRTEPGSSFLAILSMTGVLGAIGWSVLLINFLMVLYSSRKRLSQKSFLTVTSIGLFFGTHLLFEGYIYAVGSPLALMFYAYLGWSYDQIHSTKRPQYIRPKR